MPDQTQTFTFANWDDAAAFVAERWPNARHTGVGFWRIPRVATIHFFCGEITYKPL